MSTKISQNPDYSEYARKMRLALSNEDIIKEHGEINHEYFLVKKGCFWSDKSQKALIRGLNIFGVGKWNKIKVYELKDFSELEIELRTCMLLGINNVKDYIGMKFTEKELEAEKEKNINEAISKNKLKNGIYMKYNE